MDAPLKVLLINMTAGPNSTDTDAAYQILKNERPDIAFCHGGSVGFKLPDWMRGHGTAALAVLFNKDIFLYHEIVNNTDITKQLEEKWGSHKDLLDYVAERLMIVGLLHKLSKKRVLAVGWKGPDTTTCDEKKKIFIFKAMLKLCMEVRDQSSDPRGIVIGGNFNLSIAQAKVNADSNFVVEPYHGNVVDYFVHTKDITMTDIVPIDGTELPQDPLKAKLIINPNYGKVQTQLVMFMNTK